VDARVLAIDVEPVGEGVAARLRVLAVAFEVALRDRAEYVE
jgi:hypothetical protein